MIQQLVRFVIPIKMTLLVSYHFLLLNLEDTYRHTLSVDDNPVVIDIQDTAGQEGFQTLFDRVGFLGSYLPPLSSQNEDEILCHFLSHS
jgi:hypothetical protein